MSHDDATAKELDQMDVQEAQAALAEALDAEMEPADAPEETSSEEAAERVVLLDTEEASDEELKDLFGDEENPFAAAAEFAEHVRMTEALLFAAVEPLDEATLQDRLPESARIKDIMEALQQQYENRGVNVKKMGRKWQFVTAPAVAHVLEKQQVQPRKLSRAALETLAIIAYHQPCTRAEIEEVRGVAVSKGSLDILMEIGWLRLRGRKEDTPGRPLLYGTSQEFLEHFGLQNISHLPGMADLKAAGLLEARLPPDFAIPTPKAEDGVEGDENEPPEGEFVQDFHDEEGLDYDAATDDGGDDGEGEDELLLDEEE
jgi:segregation and condensation protein B